MKTIEDLKKLVSENKGELKIGALIFKWDGKDDSDIGVEDLRHPMSLFFTLTSRLCGLTSS